MSKELDEKLVQLDRLRAEVYAMEMREKQEREYPKLKKLEGTFWKYRNCYSGAREEDRWWLYRHVKDVLIDGMAVVSEFETDVRGEIKIWPDRQYPWNSLERLGVSCDAEEWEKALASVFASTSKMSAMQQ